VKKAQRLIRRFENFEEKSRKLSEIKNKLEGFIYHIREIHDVEDFKRFSTADEREELVSKSALHAQFLDGDEAYTAQFEDFNKRYTQLTNLYIQFSIVE
jgi:hypoxia up-regulated 1